MNDIVTTITLVDTLVVIAIIVTWLLTAGCVINVMEDSAVDAGAAEYYLDAEHEKQFRWKTNEVAK